MSSFSIGNKPQGRIKMARKVIIKDKIPMPVLDPKVRIRNFDEVALGYTEEMALQEAQRCIQCVKQACIKGCPVEVQIPEFIHLISEKKFEQALKTIKETNFLPGICGRVCPQESQCEALCSLGKIKGSQPVAIGRLGRFLADWDMAKSGDDSRFTIPPRSIFSDKTRVAVIGSGPAGLTCAGKLVNYGYDVTIFEAFHTTGGVLVYGIPEFRLPKKVVNKEIHKLEQLGVKIKVNCVIGKTLTIEDLRKMGYKAFFIAVGAGLPSFLNIPGTELNGVLSANEYLTRVNLMKAFDPNYDTMVDSGDRVAVFGGGNVAMDSARTAIRLGAKQVMIIYRRSENELPARREEYEHALEEGIEFHFLRNPTAILGDSSGFVQKIQLVQMALGKPDESGRCRPIPISGTEFNIDVDLVIMAIGANANPILTKSIPGLKLNPWGYINVNEDMQSSIPDIFAGGDIVTGAATVISAMGAGKKAAESIHKYLEGIWENAKPIVVTPT